MQAAVPEGKGGISLAVASRKHVASAHLPLEAHAGARTQALKRLRYSLRQRVKACKRPRTGFTHPLLTTVL
jgi:hypothetical protein